MLPLPLGMPGEAREGRRRPFSRLDPQDGGAISEFSAILNVVCKEPI
jgi:hypothetical protein